MPAADLSPLRDPTLALPDTGEPADRAHRAHRQRIHRVIDHISHHLDAQLDLQRLADVAHFSPWHFHRVFQAATGETLADCVRRLRLEAAAQRLLTRPPRTALAVALEVGFASPEVFSRAFKAHFDMTPSGWRRSGWRHWAEAHRLQMRKIHQALHKPHQAALLLFADDGNQPAPLPATQEEGATMPIDLITLPPMRLAYMRNTGPYGDPAINQMWQRFAAWCAADGPMTARQTTYGISRDSPDITPPEKCRYDACTEVPDDFKPTGDIGVQQFDGGRYASMPFKGTTADIHGAWMRVFGEWLPQSRWQADERPALERYGADLAMDCATGVFECELCVPVRPA